MIIDVAGKDLGSASDKRNQLATCSFVKGTLFGNNRRSMLNNLAAAFLIADKSYEFSHNFNKVLKKISVKEFIFSKVAGLYHASLLKKTQSLRGNCPNTELFLFRIFLNSD